MENTRRDFILSAAATAALASSARAATGPFTADVRREKDGQVRISWSGPAADVEVASQPDGPFSKVLAKDARGVWRGAAPVSPRPYFRLEGAGAAAEVAERVLPLQGGRNFRDLGGYRTEGGRMVRWGKLYRSGSMAGLTDADLTYLDGLGVQVICDFRASDEQASEPTRWSGPRRYSRDYRMDTGALAAAFSTGVPTPEAVKAQMARTYVTMAYDQAEAYRAMFQALIAGHAPLTFHCSAGKDRTGVAAALILTALGVPRPVVVQDYALTEKIVDFEAAMTAPSAQRAVPAAFESILRLPPEVRAPLMRSDPLYIETALNTLDEREGSVLGYLDKQLGVKAADVARLRDLYTKRV